MLEHGPEEREAAHVVKRHIQHEADEQDGKGGGGVFHQANGQRPAKQPFHQRHSDVPAVEHGHGKKVDDGQVDVEQHKEAQRQPPIRVHVGGQQRQNARRAAQILQPDARLFGVHQGAESADGAIHHLADLDPGRNVLDPINRLARADLGADAANVGAGVHPRGDLQRRALAVALDDDVLRFAGTLLDELDELVCAVQRDLGEHQDFIACLQTRRLRRTAGIDTLNDRVVARVEIENLEAK